MNPSTLSILILDGSLKKDLSYVLEVLELSLSHQISSNLGQLRHSVHCPIRRGSGQILGCGFLGLNPLLSGPRNGFWSIFGHLIEFGLVAQLSKQPQNGFYKVNQDMGRKFKTARVGTPLHGIGSVKSTVLIRENPQFMWPA